MPFKITAKVESQSLADLIKTLGDLDKKAARKAARRAVLLGTRIVRDAAKAKLASEKAVRFGLLKKSLGAKVKTYWNKGVVVGVVGPRRGFRKKIGTVRAPTRLGRALRSAGLVRQEDKYADPVKYAHLVEYGRKAVRAGTKTVRGRERSSKSRVLTDGTTYFGKSVKIAAAKPFMRPAWDENKTKVLDVMIRTLEEAIVKARA